jgi:lipopolysaccharide exporter
MSLTSQLLKSSSILLCMKFFQRGLGLISTLILARLLTPEDFGIVAIATLIVYFFEILAFAGKEQYLIQKNDVTNSDLNTAWTIDIILKLLLFLCFLVSIEFVVEYYDKPMLEDVLYAIALLLPITALHNPGVILYKKEFNYGPLFRISVIQKVITFILTVSIAFYIKNYWAMIIGILISEISFVIGTYWIHNFRPRLSIKNFKEQWSFSKWILLKGILGYLRSQIDTILVSRLFEFNAIGGYNMMKNLSSMAGSDIIAPATEPLLASFSKVKNNPNELRYQFRFSFLLITAFTFPLSVYVWCFSDIIIDVLLGNKWSEYAEILSAMAVLLFSFSLGVLIQHICITLKKVKTLFFYDLISLIVTLSILLLLSHENLYYFALLRGGIAILLTAFMFLFVFNYLGTSIYSIIKLITPIIIASVCSAYLVENIIVFTPNINFLNLCLTVSLFCTFYLVVMSIFYSLFYKHTPEGIKVFSLIKLGIKQLLRFKGNK